MPFTYALGEDVAVLGAKGSGKTVFTHWLYNETERAIAFNMTGEIGYHVLSDAYVVEDPQAVFRALSAGKKHVEVLMSPEKALTLERIRTVYDGLIGVAMALGNVAIFNDELANVTRGEWMSDQMFNMSLMGRHRNVSHVFAGQRNQLMPKTLVAQAAHAAVYALSPYDSAAYTKWLGFDLQALQHKTPYKSWRWTWIREMKYSVEEPVPILVDENTGTLNVEPKTPERFA